MMSDRPRHSSIGAILVALAAVFAAIGGTATTTSAGTTVPTPSDASLRLELQRATGGRGADGDECGDGGRDVHRGVP
jgi:hypothetical protein